VYVVCRSKYFRGKKILNDFDIRVEQALFSELSVASFSEQGAFAEITQIRDGQQVSR
jgi:synapsin